MGNLQEELSDNDGGRWLSKRSSLWTFEYDPKSPKVANNHDDDEVANDDDDDERSIKNAMKINEEGGTLPK